MSVAAVAIRTRRIANQWSSVTPTSELPGWYVNALSTIDRLSSLPANWDGYHSLEIQSPARTAAFQVMPILSFYGAEEPHIAPVPGGGLQFEWDFEGRELEIEILATGDIAFLTSGADEEMLEGPISDVWRQIPLLLQWLTTGRFEVTRSYLESQYATSP